MLKKINFLYVLFISSTVFCQSFIPLDKETLEFVEDVNYNLFLKKEKVFSGICSNDNKTVLHNEVMFDSISFSKIGYDVLGLKKEFLNETVMLTKRILDLDEVIIVSTKEKDIILGEQNRIINGKSNAITKGFDFGVVLANSNSIDILVDKIVIYVDKVKHKTAYKINIYEFKEEPMVMGRQIAKFGKLLYRSSVQYLNPKQKGKIEIEVDQPFLLDNKPVFIIPELVAYYDENNSEFSPPIDELTRIKKQFSNQANYFSKMTERDTGRLTNDLYNINAWINYDFAYAFFKKPHKSIIVTPAILLYAKKAE